MRTFPHRPVVAALAGLLLTVASAASAQAAPQRIVLLPFDAEASIEALGLALPTALQRALNEIDGVFVPPVGDAGVVLQRAIAAGGNALWDVGRVFGADAVVLGRVRGSDALSVELVVERQDGQDRSRTLSGRIGDLPALLRGVADALLELADVAAGTADRADLRRVLDDVPSLPSLGPLALATARLPGVRVDQLEAAAALDGGSPWVRAEFARALALAGAPERARQEAQLAVELGAHAENLVLLGIVLLAQGDPGARAAFEAALVRNPTHAVALVGLAEAGVGPDERGALLERAIAASPRLVDAHLALAAQQTSTARAIQLLRRAAASLPDSLAVQAALMDTALAAGDPRGALELLTAAVADPIGRRPAVYALAGRLPDAVATDALALVREGLAGFAADADLRRVEVDLLRRTGDGAGADAALGAWVESGQASPVEVLAWAESLAARGRVDEAQRWLAAIADIDDDGDLRSAQVDLAAGRARLVLETLEPRVASGQADALRRTLYGIALGRVGRIGEATAMLREVVAEGAAADVDERTADAALLAARALSVLEEQRRIAGDDAEALSPEAAEPFQQGLYALETGDLAAARDAFARSRAAQETGVVAFYEGYVLQLLDDPRGAIAAYEAARAALGGSDILLNNLGYAHLQVGRLDLALVSLREAIAVNPSNARAHLNLGLAYYGLARFGNAVASFDTALALEPALAATAGEIIDEARRRAAP